MYHARVNIPDIRTMRCLISVVSFGSGMVSEPMDEHVSYENFFPQMVKFTKDFLGQVPRACWRISIKMTSISVEFR